MQAHCLANTNLKPLVIESLAFLFYLIYDDDIVYYNPEIKKANLSSMWVLPENSETPFKIILWINETNTYAAT